MAGEIGNMYVEIGAKVEGFRKGMSSLGGAIDDVTKRTGRISKSVGSILPSFRTMAIAGAAAFGGLAAVVGIGIKEFMENQKVVAQTEAVLKSTGGAANVTAEHIGTMAGKLRDLSGVEDENIQAGMNMMATFTGVRNEVGAGNDIFDQATKAALNMSVALGKDMTQSSMMVGKALNDPIGGLTALRKSGVQFTDAQETMIKGMVEAGDVMGAQKIILGELETQFGGSAEAAGKTLGGQLAIVKGKFEDIAGAIVAKLMPYIQKFLDWIIQHMPQIEKVMTAVFQGIGKAIEWIKGIVGPVVDWLTGLFSGMAGSGSSWFGKLWNTIKSTFSSIWDTIKGFVDMVKVLWNLFGNEIVSVIKTAVMFIWNIIKAAFDIIKGIFDIFVGIFTGDWTRVWEGIKSIFGGIWNAIVAFFQFIWDTIKALLSAAWSVITALASSVWNIIKGIFMGVLNAIKAVFSVIWDAIMAYLSWVWDVIKGIAAGVWAVIKAVIISPIQAVWDFLVLAWNTVTGFLSGIWDTIANKVSEIWNGILGFFRGIWDNISSAVSEGAQKVYDWATSKLQSLWDWITGIPGKAYEWGKQIFQSLWDGLKSIWGSIKDWFKDKLDWLNSALNPWAKGSPSLVELVQTGTAAIGKAYAGIDFGVPQALRAQPLAPVGMAETQGGGATITINLSGDLSFPNVRDSRDAEGFLNEITRRAQQQGRVRP